MASEPPDDLPPAVVQQLIAKIHAGISADDLVAEFLALAATSPSSESQTEGHQLNGDLQAFLAMAANERRAALMKPTFAATLLTTAHASPAIVELACGDAPQLGLRLMALGYRGHLVFNDWFDLALSRHECAFRQCAAELELDARRASWELRSAATIDAEGAWLAVHRTLPRWSTDAGVHKPRGGDDGARLLRELAGTGARGVSALLLPNEHETLVAGSALLGWTNSVVPNVQSADFTGDETCDSVHIAFPR